MTRILIAAAILAVYTLTLCIVGRTVPRSLSQSVFMLPPQWAWVWTVVIGVVAVLVMPVMLDQTANDWKFLAFLACIGLAFVAVCPLSKNKSDGDVRYLAHMVGSYVCAIASQLLVAFSSPEVLTLWMPWCIAYFFKTRGKEWPQAVFFAEITCFVTTFTLFSILKSYYG